MFPQAEWESVSPNAAGYVPERLEALHHWLKTQPTTAMMVVSGGKVVFSYGDTALPSKVASVRKSILALLFGRPVVDGKINLSRTVVELGLQDREPFLPIEEFATLEHLLSARSGIYLPSGNADLDLQAPKRGSQFPGTYHAYNNWDFNAAGTAFEKLTGRNIYDALESDLAKPIGMQDFERARQVNVQPAESSHAEYAMFLSTRDLARVGLLMLREGMWNAKEVVPANWCRHITTLITPFHDVHPALLRIDAAPGRWGYGTMWWVWDAPRFPGGVTIGPFQGAYTAMGAGGQYITVFPSRDLVVAHKVNIDVPHEAEIDLLGYHTILGLVINSAR